MKEQMRLDKYLADLGIGTRTEVKGYIKKGRVAVNGSRAAGPELKIHIEKDSISFDGSILSYKEFEYYMLNKPQGVISASEDKFCQTVIELITGSDRKGLFPVGRLDKDTEGLLVITNDGGLAHQLLSPKKHVEKVYYARIQGVVTEREKLLFLEGLQLEEDFKTLPARLTILTQGQVSEIRLGICEGKFHQVKRMFEAVGMEVLYLKRLSMGGLSLDESLSPGEYRELTEDELSLIRKSGTID